MKTVLYPGSFDPFTNGHLDLVVRAGKLFDRVVVAVAINSEKNPIFSIEERRVLISECCGNLPNVEVIAFKGLVVDAVEQYHADAILRGLRAFSDFEYELQMALMNRGLKKQCETIFMTPTLKNSFISSRLVRELANFGGNYQQYVPPEVVPHVEEKLRLHGRI